jgi:phosphoglycolate phosphatase-like HAD superfamily hydrolase
MQRLAVFDVDGTLTDTNAVDDECYLDAVSDVLGFARETLDWTDAPHITDSGILRWLVDQRSALINSDRESAVISRFVELLEQQLSTTPSRFSPIRGAATVRSALERRGWHVALATGGWESSARLKLKAIGFDLDGIVMASASDALSRTDIVQCALRRATERFGAFERVVNVGDAVWDVRTSAIVGWPLVGVATGARADKLRASGASIVLADLSDIEAVVAALDAARTPDAAQREAASGHPVNSAA